MSTRIERITVEVEVPADGEPISEVLAEVMGEIEDGIQRTGVAYRMWQEQPAVKPKPAGTER